MEQWLKDAKELARTEAENFVRDRTGVVCQKGHEWRASISQRTSCGTGCPECVKSRR